MTSAAHPIPLAALDRPIAFVGATGSGKTYAAKGAVEQLLEAGRRVCIVDPTGVWWGLRTQASGGPGFPVAIFGGDHADVPLAVDAGERLGRLIAGGAVAASIVDTSEMSTGESIRLLTPMLEALYAANRAPLHLVVDEADALAPQNPMPEARRLLGVVDKIARRGRVKGFRLLSITQRPAVLNKNVLSQIATLVALRLTAPQDRKALETWIQGNADAERGRAVIAALPKLPVGSGYVWSPADDRLDLVGFPPIRTHDSSRAPEAGGPDATPAAFATIDIAALRSAMAIAEPAKVDARSYASAVAEAERLAYARGLDEGFRRAKATRDAALTHLRLMMGDEIERLRAAPIRDRDQESVDLTSEPAPPTMSAISEPTSIDAPLNGAARKMLAVLDTDPPVRWSWSQVATRAGLKARGGHFNAGRKTLLDQGLVRAEGETVRVARPSADARPAVEDPAALTKVWASALGGAAGRILHHLHGAGPTSKLAIAAALDLKPHGGHWNTAWKALRDNGLIIDDGTLVRLGEVFGDARHSRPSPARPT